MKQPDRKKFIHAIAEEVAAHTNTLEVNSQVSSALRNNDSSVSVGNETKTTNFFSQEDYKWNAILNLHGGNLIRSCQ